MNEMNPFLPEKAPAEGTAQAKHKRFGFAALREAINHSLRLKIILWSGIGFFLSAAFIIGYAAIALRNVASRSAEVGALDIAHAQAAEIQTVLERTLSAGEIFTDAVIIGKTEGVQLSREQVNAMLRQVLKDNPQFVGVDVLFEPNAFDGRDAEFVNTEGSDVNGRFLPYWTRGEGGVIQVELLQDYDISDWYQCPKLTKVSCLIDPYVYPVQGQDVWMTSLVIPFVYENTFLGITGIDTPVTFLQDFADSIDIYDGAGKIAVISNNGTLLGVTGQPDLIGQPVIAMHDHFSTDDYQMVKNGIEILRYSPDGRDLEVFVPVQVGGTASPWAVNVIIPRVAILAAATKQMWQMIGIGSALLVLSLIILSYAARQVTQPIKEITDIAKQVADGNLDVAVDVQTVDETGILAGAFNTMISQLRELLATMEQRVADRTKNLELAAEVGRTVSQVTDLDKMLTQATQLMLESFDLYYVQVYLTDPSQTTLKLEAGTGEVGAQLLERGHSLQLNSGSINGRAAVERRAVVISDTAESLTFRANPLLPDTRGEIALPLIAGEQVVGVLDMQTRYPGKLNEEVLPAFEALAGQLAVAIRNTTLLDEAEEARAELETQARRQIRTNWGAHLDAIHKPESFGYMYDRNEISPLVEGDDSQNPDESQAISAPISLTGEELGSLIVEIGEESRDDQTGELVNIVARQVAQQIENLRLLESAERYRQEAEQAARRQTREGWQEYINTRSSDSLGYLYDLTEVRPHSNGKDDAAALTLPLMARDEKVGKLSIKGLTPEDKESFELANSVAERLGAHIESLRLFEETRRGQVELDKRAKQLAAVAQVSTASSQELDVHKMLETVVHLTQRQFGLYHAHVFTYNETAEELKIEACGYREGDEHEGTHGTTSIPLTQEQSLVARAARNKQAVIVNDVLSEPGWLPNPFLPETRAELAVPLLVGDQLLGVLDVQSEHLNAFSEEDANIQLTLASQVAIALQNAYSFAQSQKQAERESMLNTINQKIQSATSVEAVLQIAARELGHALGAPMTIAQLSLKDQN